MRRKSGLGPIVAVIALFVLHNDFWLWSDGARLFGLPVGLLYHVAFCGVVSLVFWWLIASTRGGGQ